MRRAFFSFCLMAFGLSTPATGADTLAAVATNFAKPAEALEQAFEETSGFDITLAFGSTGKLYAQIVNGAPYDVLLAADAARPARLVAEGYAAETDKRAYAVGRLALWRGGGPMGGDGDAILRDGRFKRLALANPDLAPYGAAAMETLETLGANETTRGKIVLGQNIGQAHALVASNAADLGFTALSYIKAAGAAKDAFWLVPETYHTPIRQDAVLLKQGSANDAARAFFAYLGTDEANAIILSYGFHTP